MYTCLTNKNCSIEWPWYFETVFMNQWLKATFLPTISLSVQGAYSTIFWGTFFYRNLSKKWTFDLRMCILFLELLKKREKMEFNSMQRGKNQIFFASFCICLLHGLEYTHPNMKLIFLSTCNFVLCKCNVVDEENT